MRGTLFSFSSLGNLTRNDSLEIPYYTYQRAATETFTIAPVDFSLAQVTDISDKTIVNRPPPGNFHVEFLPRAFTGASGANDHAPFMVTERILSQPLLVLPQLPLSALSRELSSRSLESPGITSPAHSISPTAPTGYPPRLPWRKIFFAGLNRKSF